MKKKALVASFLVLASLLTACSGRATKPPKVELTPANQQPGSNSGTTPPTQTPRPVEPVKPADPPKPEPPKPPQRTLPEPVRGIHLSGWVAGTPGLRDPLLQWAKSAGINSIVLEIKAEDAKITWNSAVPLAAEIGANARKVGDIEQLVKEMHEQGFWVIGRIVVMNDAYLYRARPDWTIPGFAGGAYSFMDPKNENVWRYNLDLAHEAVKVGFDEIQFDYIRYPERLVAGYNKDNGPEERTAPITNFLKRAMEELKPKGVYVSADVFGLTTSVAEGDDMQIGQDYKKIADVVDFISPMIYPSHYAAHTYGLPNPDAAPYETVRMTMEKAIERTPGMKLEKHRPWIQDFTYPGPGATVYGPTQVMAQVKALRELGIHSFLLWDPSCKYTRGIDFR